MMRVLVCGDRNWADKDTIRKYLEGYEAQTVIIEGGAKGADRLAKQVAEELGFPVLEFRADWTRYGKAAGPIRNSRMLSEGKPNVVLAFHNDISGSRGTKNMCNQATRQFVPTRLISVNDGVDSASWLKTGTEMV